MCNSLSEPHRKGESQLCWVEKRNDVLQAKLTNLKVTQLKDDVPIMTSNLKLGSGGNSLSGFFIERAMKQLPLVARPGPVPQCQVSAAR